MPVQQIDDWSHKPRPVLLAVNTANVLLLKVTELPVAVFFYFSMLIRFNRSSLSDVLEQLRSEGLHKYSLISGRLLQLEG